MAADTPSDEVATVYTGTAGAPEAVVAYTLSVVDGPDRGARFDLDGSRAQRVLLGQSPACDVRLVDPEVSRRHAALDAGGGALRLSDLGSTNGTFVNGVKVIEAELFGGETLRLGSTLLHVEVEATPRRAPLSMADRFGRVLGASAEMRRLYPLCEKLAQADVPVVIEGETGTGKEVLAESLHEAGPRAAGPFLVFDCTTVSSNLVESELFGHERGAFTGAIGMRRGIFEQADGGTLLIDEIGDLDISLQPKLLRAIQRGELRRVGGDRAIKVDVRILAATRRDLDREVQEGRFRDDLFFRLAVGRIELPPLRRRQGDIGMLARAFWQELGGGDRLPYDQLCKWERESWPGNIRQLRNDVARKAALGELAEIDQRELPDDESIGGFVHRLVDRDVVYAGAREQVLAEFERRYVECLVARHGGNVSRAAATSGLALRYFQILRARHAKGS